MSKLEREETELENLRKAKSKEAKETADLLREKRKIQAEIEAIQQEKLKREQEEKDKLVLILILLILYREKKDSLSLQIVCDHCS